MYKRGELFYEGKAKKIYAVVAEPQLIWQEFKDSFTAFNGEKKAQMAGKGQVNRQIASHLFQVLKKGGVASHWVADQNHIHMVTQRLHMIPLEVVVRNWMAGSTAKRLGFSEGTPLDQPLVEFYYKKDELGDPFISDDQALLLKTLRSQEDLQKLKTLALQVNEILLPEFSRAGIQLVDFKLEFGYDPQGNLLLGDEISPDSCRLWDKKSLEKMDKDRFRRDLGQVMEFYQEVLKRLTQREV